MMATDFSHGWNSEATHRFYRIEAQSNITSENDYIFTIDGIRFTDLPEKALAQKRASATAPQQVDNSRYGNDPQVRRSSVGETSKPQAQRTSVSNNAAPARTQFQSPTNKKNEEFDPFGTNKTDAFDPFGNEAPASNFDPFGNTSKPSSAQTTPQPAPTQQNKSVAKSIFDTVDEPPAADLKSSSFDAFGNDPFNGSNNRVPVAKSTSSDFDPFGEKKPSPNKGFAPPPNNPPARKASTPTPDFSSQPVQGATRRASAIEIQQDFAGLSFEAPKAQPAPEPVQQPRDAPKPAETEPVKEQLVDPWASNLVDLDLSGKTTATRRTSMQTNSGPSLNQMMGGNPQRRASMGPTNSDPFGAPEILPTSNLPYVPSNVPIRPVNASQAISSIGQPAAPYVPMGYGVPPPAAPPAYPAMGANAGRSSIIMSNPPPMMMGQPQPPMQNTRGSFIGGPGYGAPQQPPKSSLDSLDIWK